MFVSDRIGGCIVRVADAAMKWRNSRFELGRTRVRRLGCLVVPASSPAEPGPNDDEPNRCGGQPFIDEKLNHRGRENDLRAHCNRRNGCYPDGPASDHQSVTEG